MFNTARLVLSKRTLISSNVARDLNVDFPNLLSEGIPFGLLTVVWVLTLSQQQGCKEMAKLTAKYVVTYRPHLTLGTLFLSGGLLLSGCQTPERSRSVRPVISAGMSRPAASVSQAPLPTPQFDDSQETPLPPDSSAETAEIEPPMTDDPSADSSASVTQLPEIPYEAPESDEPQISQEANTDAEISEDVFAVIAALGGGIERNEQGEPTTIDLSFTDVKDLQWQQLATLTTLTTLDLTGTSIDDSGLSAITQISSLRSLKLKGTAISDTGLRRLSSLENLLLLDVSRTKITSDGLTQASAWKKLTYLSLNNTAVSDAGLQHLYALQQLKGLNIMRTSVTAEGVAAIQKTLPGCLVITQTGEEAQPLRKDNQADGSKPDQTSFLSPSADNRKDTQLAQMTELASRQPQLAIHLSLVYSGNGQWPEAAQILQAAADANDADPELRFRLGEALAHSGLDKDALDCLRQSVGDGAASYTMGLIAYESMLRSCEQHFERAVQANPELVAARIRLQEVRQELANARNQPLPFETASGTGASPLVIPGTHTYRADIAQSGPVTRQTSMPVWKQSGYSDTNGRQNAPTPSIASQRSGISTQPAGL